MIDVEKYRIILEEGLMLDHYFLLLNIKEGKELLKSRRIQGFINLMCKKGYIEDGTLTEKAQKLLEGDGNPIPEVPDRKPIEELADSLRKEEGLKVEKKFDYASWILTLHKKCEQKLVGATGKRQVRDKIDGKAYSFLPNPTDLGKVILRAINVYRLKDFDKIESTILKYIDRCAKANKWFPILGYYIMKNAMSPMVTDMDSDDDESTDTNPSIHIA